MQPTYKCTHIQQDNSKKIRKAIYDQNEKFNRSIEII